MIKLVFFTLVCNAFTTRPAIFIYKITRAVHCWYSPCSSAAAQGKTHAHVALTCLTTTHDGVHHMPVRGRLACGFCRRICARPVGLAASLLDQRRIVSDYSVLGSSLQINEARRSTETVHLGN